MKNAANCVNQCELQDTLIIDTSNAHGGPGSLPRPRPVEGRFLPLRKFAIEPLLGSRVSDGSSRSLGREAVSESDKTWRVYAGKGFFPSLCATGFWRSVLSSRLVVRLYGPEAVERLPILTRSRAVSFTRPQLGRDDPLNLSILLRGGKENNDDSLSKGD